MNYLGFDYGTKRIGVAIGEDVTRHASPLCILQVKNDFLWVEIQDLIKKWQPAALIVGVPYNIGYDNPATTQGAHAFIDNLRIRFQLPIHEIDEHLSSFEARSQTKGKQLRHIDNVAACVLLQSWLSQRK